jgi:adenylate cyclase
LQPVDDRTFRFEGITLDLGRGCLRHENGEIELRPKSFEVLRYLVGNAGRLVTKDELLRAVWPNVTVSDESLTRCISDVRSALQDGDSRIIKTVPRRGYRFTASVSASDATATSEVSNGVAPLATPEGPSIAVLPFQNMSGDPEQDYFADGVVEEITVALSRFKWLFVIARNSSFAYKNKAIDIKQISRELGVRYVLQGSVRKNAGQVRIAGQLIDAASGTYLWAERFEGDLRDIFSLQDEITLNVISAIEPKMFRTEIELAVRRRPNDLNALRLVSPGLSAFLFNDTGRYRDCAVAVL